MWLLVQLPAAVAQDTDESAPPDAAPTETAPPDAAPAAQEQELVFPATEEFRGIPQDQSFWDKAGENLRVNVDIIGRVGYSRRFREASYLGAIGLDVHKVFSGEKGDFGTMVLQPYLVGSDNLYERFVPIDGNNAGVVQLHNFYFNLTRWGRGRTNFKIGHFDVPFGLEPINDTHWTLHQFIPMHDAGFKLDWGLSLNGSLPEFDYEVSLTNGTGMDLSDQGHSTYLVAGRIGTPTEENFVLGFSTLYGEVADSHGVHRFDEGDPGGDFRKLENWVRRLRVGMDVTQILGQFELKGEFTGGYDFDQPVTNSLVELGWVTPDEKVWAYLQGVLLYQDGHFGWSADFDTRLGFRWKFAEHWSFSGQWIHEWHSYVQQRRGEHSTDDFLALQLRVTF